MLCLEIINWSCFWDTVLFCRATHNFHCVKRVRIRSYSGPFFYAFGLNNSEYGHFSRSVHLVLAEIIAKCNALFLKMLEERFDEFLQYFIDYFQYKTMINPLLKITWTKLHLPYLSRLRKINWWKIKKNTEPSNKITRFWKGLIMWNFTVLRPGFLFKFFMNRSKDTSIFVFRRTSLKSWPKSCVSTLAHVFSFERCIWICK